MDTRPGMADLFDALADSYDAVGVSFFGPIADGLVGALAPRPGERGLDVGCGRGAALVPLARAVAPTGSAVGVDISPRMVVLAEQAVSAAGVAATVRTGDAMSPDLPPAELDVVVSSLVLFFLPDPATALRSWRELLVDGGRVGVSTFGAYDARWRETVDAVLHRAAPAGVHDARTTGAAGPFASDDGMEQLLRAAGYTDVRTVTASVAPRFDDPEHWYRWSLSVGQRQFWAAIPAGELDAVKAAVFAAVDECRDAHGRVGFDQEIRYTLGTR